MKKLTTVFYEIAGHVMWITLNRPEAFNALNDRLREELVVALEEARDSEEIYVIVITGSGEKAFCAGGDISEFPVLESVNQIRRYNRIHPYVFIRNMPKPVVAMVNGLALGGGCEIVLACDIAIASERAKFGQPELRVGVIPGGGGTQVLPRLIGEKKARELIYTGKIITASEALQMGMINNVVPHEKLKDATEEFVGVLLSRSPVILKIAKLAINRSLETTLSSGFASEMDLYTLCFSTRDQKEGANAFLEKREPNFQGK